MAMNVHLLFNMPSSSLFLVFSAIFSSAHALPWLGARPTATYTADEWSPQPTNYRQSYTDFSGYNEVSSSICGWVSGDLARPATCETGSSCIYDTNHGVVGCCTAAGSCGSGIYTSCIDSSQGNLGFGSQNDVLSCPGTSVCNRNTYPAGYYQYECGDSTTVNSIATTYSGQPSDFQLQVIFTGVSLTQDASSTLTSQTTSSSLAAQETGSSSITGISSSTIATPTSQSSNASSSGVLGATTTAPALENNNSNSRNRRLGIIIGSTLGGIIAIAGVLLAFFLCFRRKQKKEAEKFHAGAFISHHDHNRAPFQKMYRFSPDDFGSRSEELIAPETSMMQPDTTQAQNPPHPAVFPIAYRNSSGYPPPNSQVPIPGQGQPQESTPLFSEIDDFSRSWQRNMQPPIVRKPHPSQIPTPPPALTPPEEVDEERQQVWEEVTLRGGGEHQERVHSFPESQSSIYSQDQGRVTSPSVDIGVREEGWRPDPLSPVSALTPPPKNPRRLEMSPRSEDMRRYQLVDRAPTGENVPVIHRRGSNVPILHSPGALRKQRRL